MADFIQVEIRTGDNAQQELLIALLYSEGYEGFEEGDGSLKAFIPRKDFDEETMAVLAREYEFAWSFSTIPDQNWNVLWESNFHPVRIENFAGIRAEFHPSILDVQHEVIITPKMSFGTGHHATTHMMMLQMGRLDFSGKKVFDFGTGTGILAILAEKLGAVHTLAVDNDDWSIDNAAENIQKNNCAAITLSLMATPPGEGKFDIVLANINKNIILDEMAALASLLEKGGWMILSGLLENDETDVLRAADMLGLQHKVTNHRANWICMLFSASVMEINL